MKVTFSVESDVQKEIASIYAPIAAAATGAMTDAVNEIKTEGRQDIAGAGFGKKWQNTFRVDQYPRKGVDSVNAAALIYHRIHYADIFETGGTISPKSSGKLWLPLPNTPKKIGRRRATPEVFSREVAPLFSIKSSNGKPLLAAKITTTKTGRMPKPSLGKLRDGATTSKPTRAVPLFVGVNSVTLRDRFSLREIIRKAAAALPAIYAKKLNDLD